MVFGVEGCRAGAGNEDDDDDNEEIPADDEDELVDDGEAEVEGVVVVGVGRSKMGCNPTRTRGSPMGIGRSARLLKGL